MASIGRQRAVDYSKLGKHIRPYLEVYNTDGCSGGIKKYEEQLKMIGITTADRISKCTHVIWSNGRAKTLQQIKKANAEDPTKVVVVRPKWIDHLLQMDQDTVDILSKDPRRMAQINAEFIVPHDELSRARRQHSMETIGQEVDELADPDMAGFSSSQLVRDCEPSHTARRPGGGRSSNRTAVNTMKAGKETTHEKDEEDETEQGRNKMVEQSEDEAQCDLDAIMTSPKVILSQRPYAEVLASTAGSMNHSLPVGSSPTRTSLAPLRRGDVGQETMTGSGPRNRRPYGQSLLVALAADSQEVRESEDQEGAAEGDRVKLYGAADNGTNRDTAIPTFTLMLNEGPDSVGSTMERGEHSIGVGSSNEEENGWEKEIAGTDVFDNRGQEDHVASAKRQKTSVTAKGRPKGLHRKESAAGGLQVEDDNDTQGNLQEDSTKSGKPKEIRRDSSVGSELSRKQQTALPKQAVAIRNQWQCQCCTMLNRARSTKCEMCENPRGAAPEKENEQEQGKTPGGDNQGTNDTKEGRGKAQQGQKRRSMDAEGEGDTATLTGAHKRRKSSGKQAKEAEPVTKAEPSRDGKGKRETQHHQARGMGKKQEPTGAGANNEEDSARKSTEVLVVSAIEEEEKQQLLDKIKALNKLQPSRPIRLKSTQDAAASCSHLIVKDARCRRTLKMLFALARGTPIIKDEWIHQSFANQTWMDESSYLVERFEDRVGGRNKLLEGERVYVGPTRNPEPRLLRQLVHAAGGETVIVVKAATLVLADEEAGKQWVTTELTKRDGNAMLRKLVDNCCVLSMTWLFDTLEHGMKKDHKPYAIKPIRH